MKLRHYTVLGELYDIFEVEGCGFLMTPEIMAKMFKVHPYIASKWLKDKSISTEVYIGTAQAGEWVTTYPVRCLYQYGIALATYGNERASKILEWAFMSDLNKQLGI